MANKILLELMVRICAIMDAFISSTATGVLVYRVCTAQTFHYVLVQRFHQEQEAFAKIKLEAKIAEDKEFLMRMWLMAVSSFFFFLIHVITSVKLALTASPEIMSVGDKWRAAVYWLLAHVTFIGWTVIRDVALFKQEWEWNAANPKLFFIILVSLYLHDNWEGRTDTSKSNDKYFFAEKLEKAMKIIAIIDIGISAFLVYVLVLMMWNLYDMYTEIVEEARAMGILGIIPLITFLYTSVSKFTAWFFTLLGIVIKICVSGGLVLDFSSDRLCREEKMTSVTGWMMVHVGYVVWTIYRDAVILNEEWSFSSLVALDIIGILVATVYFGKKCVECYNKNYYN